MRILLVASLAIALHAVACRFPELPAIDGDAGDGEGFSVTAPAENWVRLGESVDVSLTIDRNGYTGPITLSLDAPPAGIAAAPVTVPSTATTGVLSISASGPDGAVPGDKHALVVWAEDGDGVRRMAATQLLVAGTLGTIDTTYGVAGLATAGSSFPHSTLFVEADNRFLNTSGGIVQALDAAGAADATFGSGGMLVPPFEFDPSGRVDTALLPAPGDRFFVIGAGDVEPSAAVQSGLRVARYSTLGAPDPTWTTRSYGLSGTSIAMQAVAPGVAGDSAFFVAGTVTATEVFILKVGTTAAPVTAFGAGGYVRMPGTNVVSVAPTTDGGVVLTLETGSGAELVRLDASGNFASGFGSAGRAPLDAAPDATNCAFAAEVRFDASAHIVVSGAICAPGPVTSAAIWRFDAAGRRDPTFDGDGLWRHDGADYESALSTQDLPDGSMYVVAAALNNSSSARLYHLGPDGTGREDIGAAGRRDLMVRFLGTTQVLGPDRRWYISGSAAGPAIMRLWY